MPGGFAQVEYLGHEYDVYVMNADGTGVRRLTHDHFSDSWPSFAPDGKEVAYARSTSTGPSMELDVIPSDGGRRRALATNPDGPASWSPDGRLVAFPRSRSFNTLGADDLWVVPAEGGSARRVAKGDVTSFAWSHKGRRIAFGCHNGSLCLVSARGGPVRQLTHVGSASGFGAGIPSVAWSADDRELAFVEGTGGSLNPDYSAWVIGVNGNGLRRLPRFGEGNVDSIAWLPRHPQTLLVNTDTATVYLLGTDGAHKRDLPLEAGEISISPSGRKLLFALEVYEGDGIRYHSAISVFDLDAGSVERLTQRKRTS
jgi:Tol biopolymer transport system component